MTELQKQNFEHTQRELAAADAVLQKLEEQRKEKIQFTETLQRQVKELGTLVSEAKEKASAARARFNAVIREIAPVPDKETFIAQEYLGGGFVTANQVNVPASIPGIFVDRMIAVNSRRINFVEVSNC